MPTETTGAVEAQVAAASQPQAGASQDAGQAQAAGSQGPATDTVDVAALQRELAEARREAAKYRNDAKAKETAKATTDDRIAELERQIVERDQRDQERSMRLATLEAASRLGFRNPDIAYRLIDRAAVEFAGDGTPKNVERLLSDIAKSEPYLVGATSDFGGGPRGTPPPTSDVNTLIRRAAGRA